MPLLDAHLSAAIYTASSRLIMAGARQLNTHWHTSFERMNVYCARRYRHADIYAFRLCRSLPSRNHTSLFNAHTAALTDF